MEILRKNQREMLDIKSTETEMKNAFDRVISRLDTAEERIFELEDVSVEISKTEKRREKRLEKKPRVEQNCETAIKGVNICITGIPEGEERETGTERISETIMTDNFPS